MLCEPTSDPNYQKPLENLHRVYSDFPIRYFRKKGKCTDEELLAHARAHPPLSQIAWGHKWKHLNSTNARTGEVHRERIRVIPGLIAAKETYPPKQEQQMKWEKGLSELFVPQGGGPVRQEEADDEPELHWRFDVTEQQLKGTALQERALPKEIELLTLFEWNPGSSRQRLDPGLLTMKSLHFGMMQEADAEMVTSLERTGASVHFHTKVRQDSPGKPTLTFARAQLIQQSRMLEAGVVPKYAMRHEQEVENWLVSYSIAKYEFKIPIAGLSQLTLASAHLSDWYAKKRDIAIGALSDFLDKCRTHDVDIIGCDLNQAVALRKSHTTTPLCEAMKAFCARHGVPAAYEYQELYGQGPDDCCGFLILPGSAVFTKCDVQKASYAPYVNQDLGLSRTDREAHYPVQMWLRSKEYSRTGRYKRSQGALDQRKAARSQKANEASKNKKQRTQSSRK